MRNENVVSISDFKSEKNEKILDTTFESLIPLILDEKESHIEKMSGQIKVSRKKLNEILKSENLSATEFYLLPKPKRKIYSKLTDAIHMLESSIMRIVDFKFDKEK